MKPLLLCYPACGTCRKAVAWLNENHIEVRMRDIVAERPDENELRRWISLSGIPIRRFFNTSGLKYKELNLKERLPHMSDDELYALLATDGKLIRRPVLITDRFILVGFRLPEWEKAFER